MRGPIAPIAPPSVAAASSGGLSRRGSGPHRCAPDGRLHAFCTVDEVGARAAARAVDARVARGEPAGALLAGIPVAIMDLDLDARTAHDVRLCASMRITFPKRTTSSSNGCAPPARSSSARPIPPSSATERSAITRFSRRRATRGISERTSGGSSAGSGAAVAAGSRRRSPIGAAMAAARFACRRRCAASFGIKPSWGRIPVYPGLSRRTPSRNLELGIARAHRTDHGDRSPMRRWRCPVLAGLTPRDRASLPADITG